MFFYWYDVAWEWTHNLLLSKQIPYHWTCHHNCDNLRHTQYKRSFRTRKPKRILFYGKPWPLWTLPIIPITRQHLYLEAKSMSSLPSWWIFGWLSTKTLGKCQDLFRYHFHIGVIMPRNLHCWYVTVSHSLAWFHFDCQWLINLCNTRAHNSAHSEPSYLKKTTLRTSTPDFDYV